MVQPHNIYTWIIWAKKQYKGYRKDIVNEYDNIRGIRTRNI